jgi:hypothetical protein
MRPSERTTPPCRVTLWRFYFDHGRPEVGQQLTNHGSGDSPTQLYNVQML